MHFKIDMMDLNELRSVLARIVGRRSHSSAQCIQRQRRLKKIVWAALVAISAGLLTGWIIEPVCAAEVIIQYHIPAQSLNDALLKFAADSHLELIFSADWVRGIEANALMGAMSPEQALEVLLKNTGLSFRFLDAHTVTLFKQAVTQNEIHDQAATVLEALTVVGRAALSMESEPLEHNDFMSFPSTNSHYQVVNISSATRTDTPVKQIPQSIQAINKSLIDDQQSVTVSEVLGNVSSVVPRNALYTPVVENTLVRGFRAEQLIDGFTQYYNPGDRESTVNIEQIEVLKGSNAVLYSGGSGAPVGGVINVISKLPQAKAFAEAGFKMGSYSFYQPYIDWNQPFSDNVLFRVTGEYTDSASQIDILETQRFNINPVLTITDNDSTRFTLQGKVSRWRQPDYQGLPATGTVSGDFRINPKTFIGPSDIANSESDSDAVWASLDKTFNQTWSLNFKARYATSSFDQKVQSLLGSGASFAQAFAADLPLMPPSTWGLLNAELYQKQQELSFLGNVLAKFSLGPTENRLLLGADQSDLDDAGFTDFVVPKALVNLDNPQFENAYEIPGPGITQVSMSNQTYGGYAQLQSTLFKRFHQLLGLRLGGLDMTYFDRSSPLNTQSRTETLRWLPRVGSVVDLNDAVSLFASYSEGMRGQPFVKFASAPEPELSRQLEAGVKLDINHWLSGQLAVYQIDRDHVAINLGSGFVAEGKQRSQGFEMDLTWHPIENLDVLTSYGHTDAEFVEGLFGIKAGNRLALVPQNSGRVWANYRFTQPALQGLSMGFGVYLRDAAFLSDNNQFKAAGYHSFDAAIAYETSHYKIAASAKNLSNETYFQPYDYLDGRVAPSQGASVYVTLSVKY
jgi:iron complex outermembrane receptor protein